MEKQEFVLNLPNKPRQKRQICELCRKPYYTSYGQQRYCKDPCQPLSCKEIRKGITDAVRRGEAEPIPNPTYGENMDRKSPVRKARSVKREPSNPLSRKWLSIRL